MANDDVTIQAAIDSVFTNAGGGTVYVSRGDYNIHASIVLRNNINLIGEGNRTYFIPTGILAANVFDVSGATNYDIRDITVTGNGVFNPPLTAASIPGYLGAYPYASIPASGNTGDIITVYSATPALCGIYVWDGFTWNKQAAPTVAMLSLAWPDISRATIAESAGGIAGGPYGALSDYLGTGVDVFSVLAAQAGFYDILIANSTFTTNLAADSAFVTALSAETAFIQSLFSGDINATGGITTYDGQDVNRRALRIKNSSLDILDAADTTPASAEQLRFRLGRLGVGGAVIADGELLANIESHWSDESTISIANASANQRTTQLSDGTYACVYEDAGSDIAIRTSTDLVTWAAAVPIEPAGGKYPQLLELHVGSYVCFYRNASNDLVFRTSDDLVTWSSSATPTDLAIIYNFCVIQLVDGTYAASYVTSSGGVHVEVATSLDGITWSAPVSVGTAGNYYSNLIQLHDLTFACTYRDASNRVVVSTSVTLASWVTPIVIESASSYFSTITQLINNTFICTYQDATDGYIYRRTSADLATWSSSIPVTSAVNYFPDVEQLADGRILLTYADGSNYIRLRTLQRYARVGAGIIESYGDENNEGHVEKRSDGTMVIHKNIIISSAINDATGNIYIDNTYPSLGDWPEPFANVPCAEVSIIAASNFAWIGKGSSNPVSATSCGGITLLSSTSRGTGDYTVSITGFGRYIP